MTGLSSAVPTMTLDLHALMASIARTLHMQVARGEWHRQLCCVADVMLALRKKTNKTSNSAQVTCTLGRPDDGIGCAV